MIRIELAALAAAGLALAFTGCRSPASTPLRPPAAAAPAATALPARPWALSGFRDDEDWRAVSPAPDANEMPMPAGRSPPARDTRQASALRP